MQCRLSAGRRLRPPGRGEIAGPRRPRRLDRRPPREVRDRSRHPQNALVSPGRKREPVDRPVQQRLGLGVGFRASAPKRPESGRIDRRASPVRPPGPPARPRPARGRPPTTLRRPRRRSRTRRGPGPRRAGRCGRGAGPRSSGDSAPRPAASTRRRAAGRPGSRRGTGSSRPRGGSGRGTCALRPRARPRRRRPRAARGAPRARRAGTRAARRGRGRRSGRATAPRGAGPRRRRRARPPKRRDAASGTGAGEEAAPGGKPARDAPDAGHLEALFARERRQEAGQSPREHRLAGARRARHQEVVAARGGDLEGAPRDGLAPHVGEVGLGAGGGGGTAEGTTSREDLPRAGGRSPRPDDGRAHVEARDGGGLRTVLRGNENSALPAAPPRRTPERRARARALRRARARRRESPRSASGGTSPFAARIASATARSSAVPDFGRSAGARFTTTFFGGGGKPTWRSAERMRSRLSFTAASGRPTSVRPGRPAPTAHSTTTGTPSSPTTVAEYARATVMALRSVQGGEGEGERLARAERLGERRRFCAVDLLDAHAVARGDEKSVSPGRTVCRTLRGAVCPLFATAARCVHEPFSAGCRRAPAGSGGRVGRRPSWEAPP